MTTTYSVPTGVTPDADPDEVTAAFRALAQKHHPDAGEEPNRERLDAVIGLSESDGPTRSRSDLGTARKAKERLLG